MKSFDNYRTNYRTENVREFFVKAILVECESQKRKKLRDDDKKCCRSLDEHYHIIMREEFF